MQILSAVGKKTMDKNGRFMVEASGEEYYLVNMEVYVWSALLWNFVEKNDLDSYVLSLIGQAGRRGDDDSLQRSVKSSEIQYCVSRLLRRGLLVCGEGESAEKAVADLLLKVFVTPNQLPLSLRFRAFCMGVSHGFSVRGAFSGMIMNENEKLLLGKLERSGNISLQLDDLYRVLEENAKWSFRMLPEYQELRETIKLDFLLSVVQLYKKKRLTIQGIQEDVMKEAVCL
ncbi:hypothetical protein [Enterocloster bolteae]|uniref:hypothetical protein n=1 Tax=Enterocloster bolteae TaxID=208479 RepID=UPI0028DC4E4F|nr:hypothetical protein [Enterocloster bolteae]